MRTPKTSHRQQWQRAVSMIRQEISIAFLFLCLFVVACWLHLLPLIALLPLLIQMVVYGLAGVSSLAADDIWLLPASFFGRKQRKGISPHLSIQQRKAHDHIVHLICKHCAVDESMVADEKSLFAYVRDSLQLTGFLQDMQKVVSLSGREILSSSLVIRDLVTLATQQEQKRSHK